MIVGENNKKTQQFWLQYRIPGVDNKASEQYMSNEEQTRILSSLSMWTPIQLFDNWNKALIAKGDSHTI